MNIEENFKCICGEIINVQDLDVRNRMNELGEDFYEIEYSCKCGNIEISGWGEVTSNEDIVEAINEFKQEHQ